MLDPSIQDFKMNGIIGVNPNFKNCARAHVVDNFYADPYAVREYALSQEFHDDDGYVGRRTRTQHDIPGIKEAFEIILNKKITAWCETYGMNARFQWNFCEERLVYHCDSQMWAGMIYLTPGAPVQCGTSTWQHRETKIHYSNDINWGAGEGNKVFNQKTFCDRTPYDEVDRFGNVFNRLVLFDGHLIHSASQYFGSDKYDSRLWHMFFFDVEK